MTKISLSVGALVYNPDKGFLLLRRRDKPEIWEFPKGRMRDKESENETLSREIFEECNLDNFNIIEGFRKQTFYFKKGYMRIVIFYLIKTSQEPILSEEHLEYQWLPYDKAKEKLQGLIRFDEIKYSQWLDVLEDAVKVING